MKFIGSAFGKLCFTDNLKKVNRLYCGFTYHEKARLLPVFAVLITKYHILVALEDKAES